MIRSGIRKVMSLLLLGVLVLAVAGSADALQGGPDKYGYRYIDSLDLKGPRFSMEKLGEDMVGFVNSSGKSLVPASSLTESREIGFPFEFYGKEYTYFHLSGNGYIVFAGSGTDYGSYPYKGQSVPSSDPPNRMIAPFWSDNNSTA